MGLSSSVQRVVLPAAIEPTYYDVTIRPQLKAPFVYEGRVVLSVNISESSLQTLTLHCKELHIRTCEYVSKAGNSSKMCTIKYDQEATTVTISFKNTFAMGEGKFIIDYYGVHNDQMAGFYRSKTLDRSGKETIMVSTQFEALDARRCLPCIDEPARKAPFKATLLVEDGLTALSNMPVISNELMDDGVTRKVCFAETPRMSTYLLAFCVGEFDYVESKSEHGVLIRVYTPPNKRELGNFSLQVAKDSLDLYDDLFASPYPLPKLDMIAIPEFAMGAMENWGLVTYREVDVLIDDQKASSRQKQRVASVVAHELAHQWFGNLVTMEWWDGLWLNEGFASWMQTYACDYLFQDWSMWDQFVVDDQASALKLDALLNSHPIQVPIGNAEQVEQVFDHISYYKGACVVRLVYSFLGKEAFFMGLQLYMETHKYKNTETVDLWSAWETVSKKPVLSVMRTWTEQMGFPVLKVGPPTWEEDFSAVTVDLEQEWFISDGSSPPEKRIWAIPLLVSVGGEHEPINLGIMDSTTKRVTIPISKREKTWFKFNGGQYIPMRVQYNDEEYAILLDQAISLAEMQPSDRAGLLLDFMALVKAHRIDPGQLITVLSYYKNETSMTVTTAVERVLTGLHTVLINGSPELLAKFMKFGKNLIEGPAEKIGWDATSHDGHLTMLLRSSLIRLQSLFDQGNPETLAKAQKRFDAFASNFREGQKHLPSDIKTAVIQIALSTPDEAVCTKNFDKCLELIDLADTTQEKKEIMLAIGAASSMKLKRKVLDWCTSGALKKQDFFYPIASVSSNSNEGLQLTWDYLRENFNRILDMIRTASPSLLASVVSFSCGGFASEEKAKEIEEFFLKKQDEHHVQLISRRLCQIVEDTRANARLLETLERSVAFQEQMEK